MSGTSSLLAALDKRLVKQSRARREPLQLAAALRLHTANPVEGGPDSDVAGGYLIGLQPHPQIFAHCMKSP